MTKQTGVMSRVARTSWLSTLLAACVGLSSACSGDDDKPANSSKPLTPHGEFSALTTCPFDVSDNEKVRCGTLKVPENYHKPNGRSIELAVAIFASSAAHPKADSVVYLAGGPGGSGIDEVRGFLLGWDAILAERDIITIDQRGTGRSKPQLACPQVDMESDDAKLAADARKCHDALTAQGIDLGQYNTENNALDVRALRTALKLESWNAFGVSYGTRLALELMRQGPDGLRSVVLDSTLPPDVDVFGETPRATEDSLEHIFDTCAADATCKKEYPMLEQRFYALLSKLDAKPLQGKDSNGKVVPVTGSRLVTLLHSITYSAGLIAYVPSLIAEAETGSAASLEDLGLLDKGSSSDSFSTGMYFSVVCSEWATVTSKEQYKKATEGVQPEIAKGMDPSAWLSVCPVWNVPPAADYEFTAVESELPTLLLAGAYDPATPPDWGKHVAETLPNARFSLFQGEAHGVTGARCGAQMAADFLDELGKVKEPSCREHDKPVSWDDLGDT